MGWGTFLEILAKLFCAFSSSPFTLVYPMYASARAIESDSHSINQQCLACWVLFGLILFMEMVLSELLKWCTVFQSIEFETVIPFWPYIKGVATILLAIPSFQSASYVYKHFIGAYFLEDSQMRNILFIPRKKDFIACIPDAVHTNYVQNGPEQLEKHTICKENLEPSCDISKVEYAWPTLTVNKAQGWRCALCQVSTTSEKCLKKHLQGKKHKIMEQELNSRELEANNTNSWQKPPLGWIKLNTDGSVDRENAGFGGLLRDYRGQPICAFVTKAQFDDVFLVELSAVWRGLVLASCLGIRVIWVESDSESVVETINGLRSFNTKAISCLNGIWRLLGNLERFYVSHTWRETNKAADYLSKMVLMGSDVVLWPNDFPSNLCNIIKDDAEGRLYRRGTRDCPLVKVEFNYASRSRRKPDYSGYQNCI
ncbi:hypothetical protein Patl1_08689 [Pistacia atlantica]|uniref:Uncharacterized protein n=1 Tax=Pistacia atlantica TaxID=434234 RepID=A0ACC1ALD6_9ROSI|nr:hypothetical protein Patl1_08689 [Pistacia atlantica]